jgi:hypothetical protein
MNSLLVIDYLHTKLQALNSFISHIPGFEGDTPIPVVPILAQTPSVELDDDSSRGPSARSSRT